MLRSRTFVSEPCVLELHFLHIRGGAETCQNTYKFEHPNRDALGKQITHSIPGTNKQKQQPQHDNLEQRENKTTTTQEQTVYKTMTKTKRQRQTSSKNETDKKK
jgi:hypothetical protein